MSLFAKLEQELLPPTSITSELLIRPCEQNTQDSIIVVFHGQ